MKPLISIILATFNAENTIARCLDSILGQSFRCWEIIIIDGGSVDHTTEILAQYDQHIAYWVSEPDRGIYHAWNKALDHIKGEWVLFLGADDRLHDKEVLLKMSPFLEKACSGSRVLYGQSMQVDAAGNSIRILGSPWEKIQKRFRLNMQIPHPATFHHASLFSAGNRFCEDFKIAGDYEFLLREVLERPPLFISGQIVSDVQVGGISCCPKNNLKLLKEVRKARKVRGLGNGSAYFLIEYIKNYLRIILTACLGEANTPKVLDFWRRITGRGKYWTKL